MPEMENDRRVAEGFLAIKQDRAADSETQSSCTDGFLHSSTANYGGDPPKFRGVGSRSVRDSSRPRMKLMSTCHAGLEARGPYSTVQLAPHIPFPSYPAHGPSSISIAPRPREGTHIRRHTVASTPAGDTFPAQEERERSRANSLSPTQTAFITLTSSMDVVMSSSTLRPPSHSAPASPRSFTCAYCGRTFRRRSTFTVRLSSCRFHRS